MNRSVLLTGVFILAAVTAPILNLTGAVWSQQLTYTTSWIGNTGGKQDDYVQNYVLGSWTSPTGTVFTVSFWDESGTEAGFYKDGLRIGRLANVTHTSVDRAITGDANYVYVSAMIDYGGWDIRGIGIGRYNFDGTHARFTGGVGLDNSYLMVHDTGKDFATAMACCTATNELHYADSRNGKVYVYNTATMSSTPAASWSMNGVKAMAAETGGDLWIVLSDKSLARYSSRGAQRTQKITDMVDPGPLHINAANELFAVENGPDLQIRVYKNLGTTPTLDRTIGDKGGIYSGTPGVTGPGKLLPGISGVGTDNAGNVYVTAYGEDVAFGTDIRKLSTDGKTMIWQALGLEFVDCADVDPASDGRDIYTRQEHFKIDFTKPAGKDWSFYGFTTNQFKYPDDDSRGDGTAFIRRKDGRRLLYTIGMYGGISIYYFEPEPSQIAAPAYKSFGNGMAWDVDYNCTIWEGGTTIKQYSCSGFMDDGKPLYSVTPTRTFPVPAPFTNGMERLKYIAETDVMYISGYTSVSPNTTNDWGRIGRELWRYDTWSVTPTFKYKIDLPYVTGVGKPGLKTFDIAGDYIFAHTCEDPNICHVYNANTGALVGTITPGPEIGSRFGWIDIPFGIRAFKRSNGEYLILVEEDAYAKVVMYRWCPTGDCVEPSVMANDRAPGSARARVTPVRAAPGVQRLVRCNGTVVGGSERATHGIYLSTDRRTGLVTRRMVNVK